jgi:hypothetical protein
MWDRRTCSSSVAQLNIASIAFIRRFAAAGMPANLPTHKKGIYLTQEMALVRDFQRSIRLEIQNGI